MIDTSTILSRHEDYTLEAKSAKGGFPDSFWESYSAFANSDGGTILLGVEETLEHTLYVKSGLLNAQKTKDDFWKLVSNRQKISHNIVTDKMVYIDQIDGKDVLVVEVPRADRTCRPVYKGLDPRTGTYRRNGEGDHLCSLEELGAMMRDAMITTADAKVLKGMDKSVFCQETINAYRQNFKSVHYGHLWNNLDDEMFLRRIGAMSVADDGMFYPTLAGLLMFGYEYEILRECPQYFLDYQEDRSMIGATRWKDRVVSNSGEWSGNLFDFVFKILPKLQADLKVPFVLRGNQRVDDTPAHKLLRESLVNSLSHADFYGRQGVVVSKNKDGFTFANPGRLRISKAEAVGGGISDPRNGIILKMFQLIEFGERAGSGLNGILHVWKHVFHTDAIFNEKEGPVDRTELILPFNGNKQDVDAMLNLYGNPEEVTFVDEKTAVTNEKSAEIDSLSAGDVDKSAEMAKLVPIIGGKLSVVGGDDGKSAERTATIEKMAEIILYLQTKSSAKSSDIATAIKRGDSRTKDYLAKLQNIGMIVAEGNGNKRVYRLKKG